MSLCFPAVAAKAMTVFARVDVWVQASEAYRHKAYQSHLRCLCDFDHIRGGDVSLRSLPAVRLRSAITNSAVINTNSAVINLGNAQRSGWFPSDSGSLPLPSHRRQCTLEAVNRRREAVCRYIPATTASRRARPQRATLIGPQDVRHP